MTTVMKTLVPMCVLAFSFFLVGSSAKAANYDDKNCQIFVVEAGNIVTGGYGNFIFAKVAVSKELIDRDFHDGVPQIGGYESVKPNLVEEVGEFKVFTFNKKNEEKDYYEGYRDGINYHNNTATIEVFISNGIDSKSDKNDNVWLVPQHNWQYTNQKCKL